MAGAGRTVAAGRKSVGSKAGMGRLDLERGLGGTGAVLAEALRTRGERPCHIAQ